MSKLLIKQARVIDPANNLDNVADILIENGKISEIQKNISDAKAKTLNAKNKIAMPGFVDMHTHLRQPGREDEETIYSAMQAAAKGGWTAVCAMPNTDPPCDNETIVEFVLSLADKAGLIKVYPIGAMTKGMKGESVSDISKLAKAGAVAISNDGAPFESTAVMRRVFEYSKVSSLFVMSHCEDVSLSAGGVMNEGFTSARLGLKGIPRVSENVSVAKNIMLCEDTKARLHILHISTKEAAGFVREAKQKGLDITCETCPHYFALTDEDVAVFNTNMKMNPPLRTKGDIEAIKEAIADGTIDVIATDHAPHACWEKDNTFDAAPFGVIGLETALAVSITYLVKPGIISLSELIRKLSLNPAKILNIGGGTLSCGEDADITIIDPDEEWVVQKDNFVSVSSNSPFIGMKLKGVVYWTLCRGKLVYQRQR